MSSREFTNELGAVDWTRVRERFPILNQQVNRRPLIYLDNAATTQVPEDVIGAIADHYRTNNANVHRATHTLSARSTRSLEAARENVARFVNAPSSDEIVFTGGTTDAINLVAAGWAALKGADFSAVTTALEHHSNFVPWQQWAKRTGGSFAVAPLTPAGDLDEAALRSLLDTQPQGILAFALVSNVLGTVTPTARLIEMGHEYGWFVLVDVAQAIRHERVDVQALDCDFLAFSGHKMMGPTGIGVLYGKRALLDELPPTGFGGEMVEEVRTDCSTFEAAPLRLEPGTPNYVGAIGLSAAIDFLEAVGRDDITQREHELLEQLETGLAALPRVHIAGAPAQRAGVVSFTVEGAHPLDMATLLDKMGVAARSGSQCAQPLLDEALSLGKVCRLSPAFYNTSAEVDAAVACVERALSTL